ncbi:hypothetical protein B0H14DRAFT_2157114, partial [Mycena olivaceomarginata]
PNDLDFFTPRGRASQVVNFLRHSPGRYKVDGVSVDYSFAAGIGRISTLTSDQHGYKINVIEALTANAVDAVCHFHSTAVFGVWDAQGLWIAYPTLAFTSRAIVTSSSQPITEDLACYQRVEVWRNMKKYSNRGFEF